MVRTPVNALLVASIFRGKTGHRRARGRGLCSQILTPTAVIPVANWLIFRSAYAREINSLEVICILGTEEIVSQYSGDSSLIILRYSHDGLRNGLKTVADPGLDLVPVAPPGVVGLP